MCNIYYTQYMARYVLAAVRPGDGALFVAARESPACEEVRRRSDAILKLWPRRRHPVTRTDCDVPWSFTTPCVACQEPGGLGRQMPPLSLSFDVRVNMSSQARQTATGRCQPTRDESLDERLRVYRSVPAAAADMACAWCVADTLRLLPLLRPWL